MRPGEVIPMNRDIILNEGKESRKLVVTNLLDRPVQVGSHFHFFEVNRCLHFDRKLAFGFRLDIPSGTSVRFEPGESREVSLTGLGGRKAVYGCNDLTRAKAIPANLDEAMIKLEALIQTGKQPV